MQLQEDMQGMESEERSMVIIGWWRWWP